MSPSGGAAGKGSLLRRVRAMNSSLREEGAVLPRLMPRDEDEARPLSTTARA